MATAVLEQEEVSGGGFSDGLFDARPDLFGAMGQLRATMTKNRTLPHRVIELARLRIAYRNQCRICMSMRFGDAIDEGVTESLVCELEKPLESAGLSDAEKAAVLFADKFATDHLSIGADLKAELDRHFTRGQLAELSLWIATCLGFGRIGAIFDGGEALPVGTREDQGSLAPWNIGTPLVQR